MHPTLKQTTGPLTYFGACLLGTLLLTPGLLTFGCDSKESAEDDTNAGATETDPSSSDGATSNPTSSEPMDTSTTPTDADPTELDDSDDSETTDAMTSDDEATDPDTEPSDSETTDPDVETTDSDSETTDSETTEVTSEPTESDPTSDETEPTSSDDDASTGEAPSDSPCAAPDLVWRSANKTNYESYPDPGSEECIEFNGCEWEGQFAACSDKMSEAWVAEHNIVAAFPDFDSLELHDLCLRRGDNTIVVTVLDTCGDSDCDGCCTENQGDAEQLIDLEYYTNERWGESDGQIEWADLGPTQGDGCSGE